MTGGTERKHLPDGLATRLGPFQEAVGLGAQGSDAEAPGQRTSRLSRASNSPPFPVCAPDGVPAGAFCPWPPLYDLAAGGIARVYGDRTPREVLARVVWLPPLVTSLFIAVLAGLLTLRAG